MKSTLLLFLCIFSFSCQTKEKKIDASTDKSFSNYATLIVTKIEDGEAGYTAILENEFGNLYACFISKAKLANEYKKLKLGNKVKIAGDYGNGEPIPIVVKRIAILKE